MGAKEACGFLNVNKPGGMSSSEVVEKVRKMLGVNAGHTGTLDPPAEGVLILGLGSARKFIPYLSTDKEYDGTVRLGQESDTLDASGRLTDPRPVEATEEEIRNAGETLTGDLELPVPAYSAVHSGGRRLYERVRAGETVRPPVRTMRVHSMKITGIAVPRVTFSVACAGGTYIRSIAAEWGRRLGCGALLERLVRTRSGTASLESSVSLEDLECFPEGALSGAAFLTLRQALGHLPEMMLDGDSARRLRQGQAVPCPAPPPPPGRLVRLTVRSEAGDGEMIGLGTVTAGTGGDSVLRPERMLPPGGTG